MSMFQTGETRRPSFDPGGHGFVVQLDLLRDRQFAFPGELAVVRPQPHLDEAISHNGIGRKNLFASE